MDAVFRALDDAGRRRLLDALFAHDGQSLGALCEHLPEMTRQGVMNHLRVLEEGGLVTTRKTGRTRLHYLNPVPIRLVHDRWIAKYTEPVVGALAAMTTRLEGARAMDTPTHVYKTYIACEPRAAWSAVTDGDLTVQYFYGTRVESEWNEGAGIRYLSADGSVVAEGTVLAIDPPHRLDMTFLARWDPELEAEGPARMTWLVEEASEGLTEVTVEYYGLTGKRAADFMAGIPLIVAGMKTLLETGRPLSPMPT